MATICQWAVAGAAGLFILGFTIVFVLATSVRLPSSLCPSYPVLHRVTWGVHEFNGRKFPSRGTISRFGPVPVDQHSRFCSSR